VCAAALDAQALSIGPVRGDAVVGQPLELSFELLLDVGAEVNSSCIGAELFYGDSRIDPARVRVSSRAGSQAGQALVQVASALAVNEPVVSVQVKAGCATPVSRRYVLLSSSPVQSTVATAAPVRPLSPLAESAVPAGRAAPAPSRRAAAAAAAPAETPVRARAAPTEPRQRTPVRQADDRPAATVARAVPETVQSGNRSRLELQSPLDWSPEQTLPLRATDTMATPSGTVTAEQRALAAALWRTLSAEDGASPPDGEAQLKLQALEAQVKNLQTAARMARGRENDLQAQLGEAQRERDTAWLIFWPLAALLALGLLIGGVVLWRRRGGTDAGGGDVVGKRSFAWPWKRREKSAFGADAATVFGEGFVDTQPAPVDFSYPAEDPQVPHPIRSRQPGDSQFAPSEVASTFAPSHLPSELPPAPPTSAEAAMRAARELRNGSTDELADVQQNADFFASLGQYDQAIELLQEYIASHPGTSPVAYLDLLKLFHTLSLTDPYRKLRSDFNSVFNADVPPFASFLKTSRDLGGYTDVLQRISEAWARPHVLDLIESLLVRHSGEGAHPPFQLEAYRDLLLLYDIAKVEHSADGGRLTAPPAGLAIAAAVAAPVVAAPVPPAATPAAPPDPTPPAPMFDVDAALDFPLEPEPDFTALDIPPSLGVPLDFAPPPGGAAQAPHPSFDDIALPPGGDSSGRSDAAADAGNPHLIDFDMFDVAVPPATKPKP